MILYHVVMALATYSAAATQRSAVCLSGQLRTFSTNVDALQDLRRALGGADVFMFVSRDEAYRDAHVAGTSTHDRDAAALAALAPVALEYYDATAYARVAPRDGPCHRARDARPCCHFSYHGIQFWAAGECLKQVRRRERATGDRYDWVVRTRPDARPGPDLLKAVARIVRSPSADGAPRAWFRRKKQSDAFALLSGGAVEAYAEVWRDVFVGDGCERQCRIKFRGASRRRDGMIRAQASGSGSARRRPTRRGCGASARRSASTPSTGRSAPSRSRSRAAAST